MFKNKKRNIYKKSKVSILKNSILVSQKPLEFGEKKLHLSKR